jgi:hypothetical protein
MKKLYIREVDCCFGCPNYSDLERQCQAKPKSVEISPDFDVSQNILNNCPLPDFDNILEVMGNPKPPLTQEEEDALADCGDQVALGELDSQESLSRVFMTRLIPKHRN